MVYIMVVYNIAIGMGSLTNKVFLFALEEMVFMWPIAAILEILFVGKFAKKIAFQIVKPTDRPIAITLAMSISIVWLMCPLMSLAATILFSEFNAQIISVYFTKVVFNLPMALATQLFVVGPLVRFIFKSFNKPKTIAS